jgi:hypothetical protein
MLTIAAAMLSIVVTCPLSAGWTFTPPEGYVIERVAGPVKGETQRPPCEDCLIFDAGRVIHEPGKVTIRLRQTSKASDTFDLPKGCTGEASSVVFRVQ